MLPQTWGWAVMLLGVLADCPDSVLVRFLKEAGANSFCIIAWKMSFMFCLMSIYGLVKVGGPRKLLGGSRSGWCFVISASVFQALQSLTFTLSLTLTSAANTLLFLSLNPLWAALLGRIILKERLPRRTLVALAGASCCAAVIFVPSSVQAALEGGSGSTSFLGDCLAVASGVMLAGILTSVRCASKRVPDAHMVIAPALGAGLAAVIATALAGRGALPRAGGFDPARPQWQFWLVAIADAACISACFLAVSIAPALISGAEAGLIFLLGVALGPLLVWLCYGDIPTWWTFVGGGGLLVTLAVHELAGMFGRTNTAAETTKGGGKGEDDTNLAPTQVTDSSLEQKDELTNIIA